VWGGEGNWQSVVKAGRSDETEIKGWRHLQISGKEVIVPTPASGHSNRKDLQSDIEGKKKRERLSMENNSWKRRVGQWQRGGG